MKVKNYLLVLLVCLLGFASSVSADLIGWWRFDEGSGAIAVDSSGNNLDASIEGPLWIEGQSGSALEFDGSDSLVRIPLFTTGQVQTVAAWIKIDNLETGQIFNGNGPPHMNFELASGQIQGRVYTGSSNITLTGPEVPVAVWVHVAWVWDFGTNRSELYIDGESVAVGDAPNTVAHASESVIGRHPATVSTANSFLGAIDDVRIYNHALTESEVQAAMTGDTASSSMPNPEDGMSDVLRAVNLEWAPGEFAVKHDVYFGMSFEDVNAATVPTAAGLDANSYEAGILEFGKTYYWRVDEVNGAPDNTIFKGNVWSFEIEPYSIQIAGPEMIATASSSSNEYSIPEKTVDGSGLGEDNAHGIQSETMWFTAMGDMDPWIQYEFDSLKKLDVMKVWNSNTAAEDFVGYGVKGVLIEYSKDGQTWDILEDANEFSQAPGLPTYTQYDEIAFGGIAAKMVRLSIQSNWGGFMQSYSLGEVQFMAIPAAVRTPAPVSGSTHILPGDVLSWRAGREAVQSVVYLSADPNDVADAVAPSVTSSTHSIDLSAFDVQLGQTYYWRVDEVNDAEVESVWAGPVWSLTLVDALVVDDFEGYTNDSPNRPFQTWLDGFGFSADEFFPTDYLGNGTGSGVGHDIWSVSSPQYNGNIMEGTIVKGGQLSMPLYFNNTNGSNVSETERALEPAQDWTVSGIKSLSLNIYGTPGNTGQLYLKINNTRINYDGLSDAMQRQQWVPWNIDLSGVAGPLQNVTSLAIGIEGAGATGVIYIDDVKLYSVTPVTSEPVIPDASDPNLVAFYEFEGNADDTTGAYHGTATGDPEYAPGKVGQAMVFDGTDDNVTRDIDPEEVWSAYSISLWARTDIFGQVQYKSVFNNNSSNSDFQIDVDGSDPGVYRYWGSQGATLGPVTSDWVHLAVSCDGTMTSLYYNGLRVTVLEAADTLFGQLSMGVNRGMNQPFAGSIDEVRVYNRALSDVEMAGLAGITEPVPTAF